VFIGFVSRGTKINHAKVYGFILVHYFSSSRIVLFWGLQSIPPARVIRPEVF
jgi:hypothetical protein